MKEIFDAIVVGSGISGGWVAKELCEKGLKVLLLERGRQATHKQYPHEHTKEWELPYRGKTSNNDRRQQPVQSTLYAYGQASKHWFINDIDHPYIQKSPFIWHRGNHLGGRSIMWGRQTYRLSDIDFEANLKEGIGVDWPIRYKDIAPWYDYVEEYCGISGQNEGLAQIPDGIFHPPMDLTAAEIEAKERLAKNMPEVTMTIGRCANITKPHRGRFCQKRNLCARGCSFGGYFSSLSTTLIDAMNTGNLTVLTDSLVVEVVVDEDKKRAKGVRVLDCNSRKTTVFESKILFLNASTLGTTQILLQSKSKMFPQGIGNNYDVLGRYLMDHNLTFVAGGSYSGAEKYTQIGKRPNGFYIPRFTNLEANDQKFLRGFGIQGGITRSNWKSQLGSLEKCGDKLLQDLKKPGSWYAWMSTFGEILPHKDNRVQISNEQQDIYGLPVLEIDMKLRENELEMNKFIENSLYKISEAIGVRHLNLSKKHYTPGEGIHEMGTARMGRDPRSSVLNKHNQVHELPNLFVTDGACMTSSACQNPSLTYMALSARAAHFAVQQLKNGNL